MNADDDCLFHGGGREPLTIEEVGAANAALDAFTDCLDEVESFA